MQITLEHLTGALPVVEEPGLSATDARFDEIATLIQQGEYLAAADRSAGFAAAQVFDIRLIAYQIYGVFLEQGVAALEPIAECLGGLLTENWEAIGPLQKRERLAQSSLEWLHKQILKTLQYETGKQSETWHRWSIEVPVATLDLAIVALGELTALQEARFDTATSAADGWGKIREWVTAFRRVAVEAQTGPTAAEPDAVPEPVSIEPDTPRDAATADLGTPATSYHLEQLLRKLAAFERLVKQEKFPRAALLADDINQALAHFDPKLYFPHLFGTYAELFALHVSNLNSFADHRGSVEWLALQELLKVDIDRFVEL